MIPEKITFRLFQTKGNTEMTIQEQIAKQKEAFRLLSRSRQNHLRRDAEGFCNSNPDCANHNGFWRGLSARHVLEAYYGK
jgi:hypothetical protein